jgi:hypothetical protein
MLSVSQTLADADAGSVVGGDEGCQNRNAEDGDEPDGNGRIINHPPLPYDTKSIRPLLLVATIYLLSLCYNALVQ